MSAVVELQFRPSVLVFVQPAGVATDEDTILDHFRNLCAAGLDQHFDPSVGLITITEGEVVARPRALRDEGFAPGMPTEEAPFPDLFDALLRCVMNRVNIKDIEARGFPVPQPQAQVFIVGGTDSATVAQVAQWTNQALQPDRINAHIAYFLVDVPHYYGPIVPAASGNNGTNGNSGSGIGNGNGHNGHINNGNGNGASPFSPYVTRRFDANDPNDINGNSQLTTPMRRESPSWVHDLYARGGRMPNVNFCYIFQEMGLERDIYWNPRDVRYAAAEALFALAATGLSAAPTHKEVMRVAPSIGRRDVDGRIGGLGTSLIRFPRPEAERYCADVFGADLLREWVAAMAQRTITDRQKAEQQDAALQFARRLRADLEDNEPRPGAEDVDWPSLDFYPNADERRTLRELSAALFETLEPDSIAEVMDDRADWPRLAAHANGEARRAQQTWRTAAEQTWSRAGASIEQSLKTHVAQLWLRDDAGVPMALAYVERLDGLMEKITKRLHRWRGEHAAAYDHTREQLAERAIGPWLATSSAEVAAATDAVNNATGTYSGDLPEPEKKLVAQMTARIDYQRRRLPTRTNLIGLGVAVVPILTLLLLTLLPARLHDNTPFAVGVGLGTAVVVAGIAWLYHRLMERQLAHAEDDLLEIYRNWHIYQCEDWEDQCRVMAVAPLARQIKQMAERLHDIAGFLRTVEGNLRADAARTETALFTGPSGVRDVFIANGHELQPRSLGPLAYQLGMFYDDVHEYLRAHAETPEAMSPHLLNRRLREYLAASNADILTMDVRAVGPQINRFTRGIIAPALQGEMVSIGAALHARGDAGVRLWQKALHSAAVLFRPYNNPPELVYIGGRDEYRATVPAQALPPATTMLQTHHPEWLLVARFWSGGAGTPWGEEMPEVHALQQRLPAAPAW